MKYYVNEDERLVIAIMENTENDAIDFLWANNKYIPAFSDVIEDGYIKEKKIRPEMNNITYDSLTKLKIRKRYVGKARAHESDVFDVETGKKIAAAKAKYKHDKALRNVIINELGPEITRMHEALTKIELKFLKSSDDIMAIEDI